MDEIVQRRMMGSDVEGYKREVLEESVLVAPAEAARILSCSKRKVYDLVKCGDLHGYSRNPGGRGLRLLAAELADYVRSIKIDKDRWRE